MRAMFARIVPRYDLVNRLMTMGLDRRWRRETAAITRPSGAFALDIATGTGDLALELARQGARRVVGADFCADMLSAAVVKRATAEPVAGIGQQDSILSPPATPRACRFATIPSIASSTASCCAT